MKRYTWHETETILGYFIVCVSIFEHIKFFDETRLILDVIRFVQFYDTRWLIFLTITLKLADASYIYHTYIDDIKRNF